MVWGKIILLIKGYNMKRININKKYRKLRKYCEYYFDEEEECKSDYYLFDVKTYKFVHVSKLGNIDNNSYIDVPKFDNDYSMIDFYIKLSKYDKQVIDYFSSAKSIEEKCIKLRRFTDWNKFEGREDKGYDEYLAFCEIFINWCEENKIDYVFKKKKPPKSYCMLEHNKPNYKWIIPE